MVKEDTYMNKTILLLKVSCHAVVLAIIREIVPSDRKLFIVFAILSSVTRHFMHRLLYLYTIICATTW